jgi:hypothetical protein
MSATPATCVPNPVASFGMDPKMLARPAGLEPAAYGFEVRRSIQLSYGRTAVHHTMQIHAGCLRSPAMNPTIRVLCPNTT